MIEVDEFKLVLLLYNFINSYDMQPVEQEDVIRYYLKNYLHVYNEQNAKLFDDIIRDKVKQGVLSWIESCIKR